MAMLKVNLATLLKKFNVVNIVTNHVKTLKSFNSDSISVKEVIFFFGFPFILSTVLVFFGLSLNRDFTLSLANVFALFTGFLFNLLVLIYNTVSQLKEKKNTDEKLATNKWNKIKLQALTETYYNISFGILVSLATVISLAISSLADNKTFTVIMSFLIFGFSTLFVLTLLMVLKRIYNLITHEIS